MPSCCAPPPSGAAGTYRPRASFQSPLWRLVSDHLDAFLWSYEERHRNTHGPLGRHVEGVLDQFLLCGDPNQGILLLRCEECRTSLAVPYSCRTRLCPSCMTRRAEDLAAALGDLLPVVRYCHVVVTFPIRMGIRHRVRENPGLLRRLTRLAVGVLTRALQAQVRGHRHRREELQRARPGLVVAWQTFGDSLNFHPHLHILASDGVFLEDGQFYGYLDWDADELTARLRDSVLASFTRIGLLEEDTARTMQAWPVERSGFQVHVERAIPEDDREQLRTVLRYLTRAPVALERLRYDEATAEVHYRTRKGLELRWAHAVDFLADLTQHIPPPRRQTVSYHGHFANALGRLERRTAPAPKEPASPEKSRRMRWARLVLRVWKMDPELCPSCGKRMTRTRAVMERAELVRLLAHLRLGGYPARPPPVPVPVGPAVTYGAVGRRRGVPRPELLGPEMPGPVAAEREAEESQVPPGWEDWEPA